MVEDENPWVDCYSGSRYAERPRTFQYQGRQYAVAAVLRQWRLPEGTCFRVITQDEHRFDLIYNEDEDHWEVLPLG